MLASRLNESKRWGGRLVLVLLLALANPTGAWAAPGDYQASPNDPSVQYQAPWLGVALPAEQPLGDGLLRALRQTGRFALAEVPLARGARLSAMLQQARSQNRSSGSGYVLVPTLRVGRIERTGLQTKQKPREGGGFQAVALIELVCPIEWRVALYDLSTGGEVALLSESLTLKRPFSFNYDEKTSQDALQLQIQQLASDATVASLQSPERAFGDYADRCEELAEDTARAVARQACFRLEIGLAGWSVARDRIAFNLGRNVRLSRDAGFRVMKGSRQTGYVKLRELGDQRSEAQPLYLTERLDPSQRLLEDAKWGLHLGLRAPLAYVRRSDGYSATFAGGGVSAEWDMAPLLPGPTETYATFGSAGLISAAGPGMLADLGLAKKFYWGRNVLRIGFKGNLAMFGQATLGRFVPGAAGSLGGEYHLSEHLLLAADLDGYNALPFQAEAEGPLLSLLGGVARLGVSFLF
ncbi:MAG: hypothetical protein VKP62_07500 [Candidatus Sericytochromatia bacterium]|nr:hypothetical protein [Candidatus Sericytochromatia bacterium]